MVMQANRNRHCTFTETLDIAKDMKAKRVLLTHFSMQMHSKNF
jgi:ribonuclease BN (tRNA processing enzyme)